MMRGNTLAALVGRGAREELAELAESERIYFADAAAAGGILEAMNWYDFLGSCRAPEAWPGGAKDAGAEREVVAGATDTASGRGGEPPGRRDGGASVDDGAGPEGFEPAEALDEELAAESLTEEVGAGASDDAPEHSSYRRRASAQRAGGESA